MSLGSGIRDPEKPIPDPGYRVKKAPDPVSPAPLLTTYGNLMPQPAGSTVTHLLKRGPTEIFFRNGLAEGEARTEEPLPLHVSENEDEKARLLPLRAERPARRLAEQVDPVDERDVRPVALRKPLYNAGQALLGIGRHPFPLVIAAHKEIVR